MHAGGQGFEPLILHQKEEVRGKAVRGKKRAGNQDKRIKVKDKRAKTKNKG